MRNFDPQEVLSVLRIDVPDTAYTRGAFNTTCMLCDDKRKHLHIDMIGGRYYCYRCGEGGSLVQLYGRLHIPPLYEKDEIRDALRAEINAGTSLDQKWNRRIVSTYEVTRTASVEIRDKVYSALLSTLRLEQSHKRNLMQRGLSEEEIRRRGYKSTKKTKGTELARRVIAKADILPEQLKGVPGFFMNEKGEWEAKYMLSGIFVPYRDLDGRITGMQIRVDDQERKRISKRNEEKRSKMEAGVGKYVWYTSANMRTGCKYGAQGDAGPHHTAKSVTNQIILTEGGLKGDIISHYMKARYLVIAIAGTTATKRLPDVLKSCKEKGARRIMLAMDMDQHTNPAVEKAVKKLVTIVQQVGLECSILQWEREKGLDDFLKAREQDSDLMFKEMPLFY